MNRREALSALIVVGASTGVPAIQAQSPKPIRTPILGVLSAFPIVSPEKWATSPFWTPLRSFGWIEGENLRVERASSYPSDDQLPALAEELVRKKVDVIFAASNESAVAAAHATKTIPIVFWGVNYPVELGLVESLARPGGNVTGIALHIGPIEFTKTLEFLKEIAPSAARLSYIYETAHMRKVDGTQWQFANDYIETAAKKVGFDSREHALSRPDDLDAVLADVLLAKSQALYVSYSKLTIELRGQLIEFANRNRLPSAFNSQDDVEMGGLLSYGPDLGLLFRRAASHVDKVLRGAKPQDVPVELPTTLELVVNRRTAKMLSLAVSPSLQARTDLFID